MDTWKGEFQLVNGLYEGELIRTYKGLYSAEFISVKQGKYVNLGPMGDHSDIYYYAVDEDGNLFVGMKAEVFEYTFGMPGYAEHFLF